MKTRKLDSIAGDDGTYLFQNYGDRLPVCFTRGEGSHLFDQDNRRYVDFFSGIAVSSLGYGNRALARAIHVQADRILHSSNWYFNREQNEAARLISGLTFPGKTLFTNSGTEANEAALKLARLYGRARSDNRYQIISFSGSFHGRTFGAMSATGQEKIRKGFDPLLPGFIHLPFNDFESLRKEIEGNAGVCAVITELIQGEGGIRLAEKDFIVRAEKLCRERGVLLIIDEVQTGVGRTGKFCVYQHYGIRPDIITFAKGLGGGVPIGAIHARADVAKHLEKGTHGTTFGGNHLACAAATAVMKTIGKKSFMDQVLRKGEFIRARLAELKAKTPIIREIRGMGLHTGVELDRPGLDLVKKALGAGLVINCTSENVIRIMPPLTIDMKTIREGIGILEKIITSEGGAR
jgi:acetylornithine/N-succinyldiaminopimelate aminotransferase